MSKRTGYSPLQIMLHWLVAVLILGAWLTQDGAETQSAGTPLHVWLGGAAFVLILIRVFVRLIKSGSESEPGTSNVMELAAVWGHRVIYLLMVLTPALGALAWYGGIEAAGDAHELAANALLIVALAHAATALWHHYVMKDNVLRRMMRPA